MGDALVRLIINASCPARTTDPSIYFDSYLLSVLNRIYLPLAHIVRLGPLGIIFPYLAGIGVMVGAEVEDLPQFKVRDDDVWVCSWPRSGEPHREKTGLLPRRKQRRRSASR